MNASPLECDLHLTLLRDLKDTVFDLEPKRLKLLPGQSDRVTLQAFPHAEDRFEDTIICTVKNNPEPLQFHIACNGALPRLTLDTKVFNFDRVMLRRYVFTKSQHTYMIRM